MTVATLSRAEFLKAEERTAAATDAATRARWGESAVDTRQSTALATEAAAAAEAARQRALMGQPMAEDAVRVQGVHFDLEGATVRVRYLRPDGGAYFGGAAQVDLLVTTSTIDLGAGVTTIRGLVRL